DLLDRAPGALVLGALLGQNQTTFLVLLLQDKGLDVLTSLDHIVGIDVMLDRQLTRGNDSVCCLADVEQDLVSIDLDDGAFDNVAVIEILDGLVDRGEECFLGPDVVDRYLRGRGCFCTARHVWVGSGCGQGLRARYGVQLRAGPGISKPWTRAEPAMMTADWPPVRSSDKRTTRGHSATLRI